MGLANVSMVASFYGMSLRFLRESKRIRETGKIVDCELKIWDFPKIAAFSRSGNFPMKYAKSRNLYRRVRKVSFRNIVDKLGFWDRNWRDSRNQRGVCRILLSRGERKYSIGQKG